MPADFVYRQASSEDALCLSVLASQVFLDTYATNGVNLDLAKEVSSVLSKESFLNRLERDTVELFVATHAGYMVGFLDLDLVSRCPDAAVSGVEILRLYVQQPFQRRTVGRTLMTLAEERVRSAGHKAIWLTAWVGNLRARDFYRTLGYKDVGVTQYVIEGQEYENRILVKELPASADSCDAHQAMPRLKRQPV
jgi:ribosomal protein S18 acetylase RimI-like enzyme